MSYPTNNINHTLQPQPLKHKKPHLSFHEERFIHKVIFGPTVKVYGFTSPLSLMWKQEPYDLEAFYVIIIKPSVDYNCNKQLRTQQMYVSSHFKHLAAVKIPNELSSTIRQWTITELHHRKTKEGGMGISEMCAWSEAETISRKMHLLLSDWLCKEFQYTHIGICDFGRLMTDNEIRQYTDAFTQPMFCA